MSLIEKGLQISRFFWLITFLMFLAINKSLCLTDFKIFLLIVPKKKHRKFSKIHLSLLIFFTALN